MNSVLKKIKKRIKITYVNFIKDCHFSIYYAFLRIFDEVGGRVHLKRISRNAHLKKDKWILKYLRNSIKTVLEQYTDDVSEGIYEENAPIWVCWWTGENNAPKLVQQCIKSIKQHSRNHPVCLIDKNTYSQYISIPDYMLQKVDNGHMGLAHLADYMRVSLIEQYGGLWLDATIFCSDEIPEEYFEIPFFTCKSNFQECGYISKMQWTTFVLGGWRGNVFYKFMKSAFETYWKRETVAIDYLFFDYLIALGWEEIPRIRESIENLPINNIHRDDLQAAMNQAVSAENFYKIIKEDTKLYKLSWRETYSLKTMNDMSTVYAKFVEE